jgi:hypothetical protein
MANGVMLTSLGATIYGGIMMWVLIRPLALVFFISFRINSLSVGTAQLMFWLYAALLGVSLSSIFVVYTAQRSRRCSSSLRGLRRAVALWLHDPA